MMKPHMRMSSTLTLAARQNAIGIPRPSTAPENEMDAARLPSRINAISSYGVMSV